MTTFTKVSMECWAPVRIPFKPDLKQNKTVNGWEKKTVRYVMTGQCMPCLAYSSTRILMPRQSSFMLTTWIVLSFRQFNVLDNLVQSYVIIFPLFSLDIYFGSVALSQLADDKSTV